MTAGGVVSAQATTPRPATAATRSQAPARVALAFLAAIQAEIGIWGQLAPRGFYGGFPGAGHHWVSALGAYDQHLVRDYASLELGFAVLLACAAIWFERRLVLAAGAAFLAATVAHFVFHLTTTGALPTGDNAASLGSFVFEIAIVAWVMARVARSPERTRP
jgi:hypothetical protein